MRRLSDVQVPASVTAHDLVAMLDVSYEWILEARARLPWVEIPSDNGVQSIDRMRVTFADLPVWRAAAHGNVVERR